MTPKIHYMKWSWSWLLLSHYSEIVVVSLLFHEKTLPIKMTLKIHYMKWLQSWLLLPYFNIEIVTLRFGKKNLSHKNDPQNPLHDLLSKLTIFDLAKQKKI